MLFTTGCHLNLKPNRTWVKTRDVYAEDKRQGTASVWNDFDRKHLWIARRHEDHEAFDGRGKLDLECLKDEVRTAPWMENSLWGRRETDLSYHTKEDADRLGPAVERREDKVVGVTEDIWEIRVGQQGLLTWESKCTHWGSARYGWRTDLRLAQGWNHPIVPKLAL